MEREEKMTNIAKAKSGIFRNYTLGFATLATIIKMFFIEGDIPSLVLYYEVMKMTNLTKIRIIIFINYLIGILALIFAFYIILMSIAV
ncbi:TPA: hypothetical protein PDB96_000025 [Staphylococcus aureus]|nr:hypothetical protein [Staphylococcus aureus]